MLPLLKDINVGKTVTVGKEILVIGGGDVAMDSVRSALRLSKGGHVTLVYRRTGRRCRRIPRRSTAPSRRGSDSCS